MNLVEQATAAFRARINKERYHPTLLGALVNPNYISRRIIRQFVASQADAVTGRMLDFGGGEKPYRDLFSCNEYICLEYAPTLDSGGVSPCNAERRRGSADIYYDGHVLPFSNHAFDAVLATEVFEHIFNLDEILAELNRVLVDNGVIIATIPFAIHEHEAPNDFARYTSFGIRHIFQCADFECIAVNRLGSYPAVISQQLIWSLYEQTRAAALVPRLAWSTALLCAMPLNLLFHFGRRPAPANPRHFLNLGIVARKRQTGGNVTSGQMSANS